MATLLIPKFPGKLFVYFVLQVAGSALGAAIPQSHTTRNHTLQYNHLSTERNETFEPGNGK